MNEHLKRAVCLLMSMLLAFSGIPVYAQEAEPERSAAACENTPVPEFIPPDAAETVLPDPTPSASATPSETLEPLDTSESTAAPETDASIEPLPEETTSAVTPDKEEAAADPDAENAENRIPSLEDLNALNHPSQETEFIIEDTRLTAYRGEGGDVVVPDGVTVIGAAAFNECDAITSILLPETLLTIEENAFAGCVALEKLHIPASVNEIAELHSLFLVNPDVRIELSYGSYAEQFCIDQGFDYRWFDHEEPAPILPTELIPAQTSIVLGVGQTISVANWTLLPEGAQDSVSYKSKSTKIASVSGDGIVTAKKTGSTTIALTSASGLTASIKLTVKKAPSSIKISAARTKLGVGEELQLGYTITAKTVAAVSFESLNPEIASVTSDGKVVALASGTATIQAKTHNNKKSTIQLNICPAPETVIPALNELRIGAEDSYVLCYALNEGAAGEVHFASADEAIATVDSTGRIYAVAEGETQITIETYNGMRGVCKVSVVPAPNGISLSAAKTTLGVNETLQLNALIDPEGTLGTIHYKSSKSSTVSVDANGLVKAKRTGTAIITATTYNGKTADIKITVKKAPSSVNIKMDRSVLGVGEELQLGYTLPKNSVGEVSFESLNPEILQVRADGQVTALSVGTGMIRATTYNGKKRTAAIEVKPAPDFIILSEQRLTIGLGDLRKLSYSLNTGSAGAVCFESDHPEIASIDGSGNIQANSIGTARIIASGYNGISSECIVSVVPAPESIDVSALRTKIGLKESVQLQPKLLPAESAASLKYKSSKTSVVSVSSNGVLTGKKTGSATITISAYNGVTASFRVNVEKAATGVKITAERDRFGAGEETDFTAKVTGAGAVHFESSDPGIMSIDPQTGHAVAAAPGQVKISACTYNGKVASSDIIVTEAPAEINIHPSEITIGLGDTMQLSASLPDGIAGTYTFSSSDPSIASVDPLTGEMLAVALGTASICATAYNGVMTAATVNVIDAPSQLTLRGLEQNDEGVYLLNLTCGEIADIEPDTGAYSVIHCLYSASNDSVTISPNGRITAKSYGDCMITVSTYSETASVQLLVHVDRLLNRYPDPNVIMHAMGAVDGHVYSNSREAFLANYARGNRMFEVDLQYTSDNQLVLWHNWNTNRINSSKKAGYVPTEKEFASMLIYDQYDSLTYKDLLKLMDEYPDAYFYMDTKKTAAKDVRKQYQKMVSDAKSLGLTHVLDRMVVMIYNESMYDVVHSVYPFSHYVLMCYKLYKNQPTPAQIEAAMQFCENKGIDIISMWDYWWQPEFKDLANAHGLKVNLHTINSADSAKEYVQQGVILITTDHLSANSIQ